MPLSIPIAFPLFITVSATASTVAPVLSIKSPTVTPGIRSNSSNLSLPAGLKPNTVTISVTVSSITIPLVAATASLTNPLIVTSS